MDSANQMSETRRQLLAAVEGPLPPLAGTSPIADVRWPRIAMPVLFISGCNLCCPYCINRGLLSKSVAPAGDTDGTILRYLAAEEPWLMVSGAEPLNDLRTLSLLSGMKTLGFKVALATNGTHPSRLAFVLDNLLADHVVMDVKTVFDFGRYREVTGGFLTDELFEAIKISFSMLRDNLRMATAEWRMTMCGKFVGRPEAEWLANEAKGRGPVTLQMFSYHQTLSKELADPRYSIPFETLAKWAGELSVGLANPVLAKEV